MAQRRTSQAGGGDRREGVGGGGIMYCMELGDQGGAPDAEDRVKTPSIQLGNARSRRVTEYLAREEKYGATGRYGCCWYCRSSR